MDHQRVVDLLVNFHSYLNQDEEEHKDQNNNQGNGKRKRRRRRMGACVSSSSSIPDDLVFEILVRIHPKFIERFRYVCKNWLFMISSDTFMNRFHQQIDKSYLGIIMLYKNQLLTIKLEGGGGGGGRVEGVSQRVMIKRELMFSIPPTNFGYKPDIVLQSVDGLVCILVRNTESMYVCNPVTKEFISLPYCQPYVHYNTCEATGFGYSLSGSCKVYKVILVKSFMNRKCVVYTLQHDSFRNELNEWRLIEPPKYNIQSGDGGNAVFVDGVMYWRGCIYMTTRRIISFDVGAEEFGDLAPPEHPSLTGLLRYETLAVLLGSLCVVNMNYVGNTSNDKVIQLVNIWRMTKDNSESQDSSWMRIYSIDLTNKLPNELPRGILALMSIQNGRVFFRDEKYGLVYYDIETQIFGNIGRKVFQRLRIPTTTYKHGFVSLGVNPSLN